MPRYIDAERKVNAQYYDEMHEEWLWKETSIDDVLAEILDSEVPTADVVEVKYGKWIWMGEKGDLRFMCSVCKSKENVPTCNGEPTIWWYCPNCGAYMRKETEDE